MMTKVLGKVDLLELNPSKRNSFLRVAIKKLTLDTIY
jgi:hypothetical protein